MAFSNLVQAFANAWGSLTGAFAENDFENVNWLTFQNFSNASAVLHDRGPNAQRGLHKRFRYLTQAEVAANGGEGEAFESLDYDTCCVGTQIVVQYYQPDPLLPATREQLLVAAYDPDSDAKFIYSDGSFRAGDRIAAAKFVPAKQAQYGYVRRDTDPASISDWRVGELSLWELAGEDEFATAKQAGGPWPAYTGVEDAYWKPAAAPEPLVDSIPLTGTLPMRPVSGPIEFQDNANARLVSLFGEDGLTLVLRDAAGAQVGLYVFNDTEFTLPGGTLSIINGRLYINGQPSGSDFVRGSYKVKAADIQPDGTVAITVPNAVVFASIGLVDAVSGLLDPLAFGVGYTQSGNTFTVQAVTGVEADDIVQWGYLTGTVQAAVSFANLTGNPGDNPALATALAGKADLDANGKVVASQIPNRYKIFFEFPAGQTTTSARRIVFPDMPGNYVIEVAQYVQVQAVNKNGAPAPVSNGFYTLAYLDTIAVQALAQAGQAGYVIMSQVI